MFLSWFEAVVDVSFNILLQTRQILCTLSFIKQVIITTLIKNFQITDVQDFFNFLKKFILQWSQSDNEISCFEEGGYCDSKTSSTCVSGNLNENLCSDSERACCMGGLPATTTTTTTTTKRPTTQSPTTQSTTDYPTDYPELPSSAENFAISAIFICSIFIFHLF